MQVWWKSNNQVSSSTNSEGYITPVSKPNKKITQTCEYHNLSCCYMEDIENAGLSNETLCRKWKRNKTRTSKATWHCWKFALHTRKASTSATDTETVSYLNITDKIECFMEIGKFWKLDGLVDIMLQSLNESCYINRKVIMKLEIMQWNINGYFSKLPCVQEYIWKIFWALWLGGVWNSANVCPCVCHKRRLIMGYKLSYTTGSLYAWSSCM